MERLEDLLIDNLKIYQDDELYCFTSDAVLLSKFARVKKGDKVADFCSGSGIVGINLLANNKDIESLTLFEMQTSLYNLSKKTIEYNGLNDKVSAVNVKVQDIDKSYNEYFSLIVCNPPYMEGGSGFTAEEYHVAVCKAEIELTLAELVKAVARTLKYKGRFALVHRADRLTEIFYQMKKNNIEPKRMQLVCSSSNKPYLVLVEGVKGGKSGIEILPNAIN